MTTTLDGCGDAKGTHTGYTRHRYQRQPACDECREAHNTYTYQFRNRDDRGGPVLGKFPKILDPAGLPNFDGAICAQVDPELFFPDLDKHGASQAKRICAQCPARVECLAFALANHEIGIWGGTTGAERDAIRRQRRRSGGRSVT